MNRIAIMLVAASVFCASSAIAQKAEKAPNPAPAAQPASELADGLAHRLSQELHARTLVGQPIQAGSVTLIPILMVDVNFVGGGLPTPPNAPATDGFLMSGEARPLGFVAITPKGTKFITVGKTPANLGGLP